MRKAVVFTVLALVLPLFFAAANVFAQITGLGGVSNNLEVSDAQAKPGDIMIQSDEGIVRASVPYDARMIGVVIEFPVISAGQKTDSTRSVMVSGQALVNVSAVNGEIKKGDLITTSDEPGVGQRAGAAGYVLGKALGEHSDASRDGQVPVLVNVGPNDTGTNLGGTLAALLAALTQGFQNAQNFPLVLRYLLAFIISLATFVISAFSFVRFMRNGLEAIGRNPMARRTIISGMVLNAVIAGVLMLAGFGIAVSLVAF